ncbi:MAG: filamentous hemagglutinin N-terminal domain-containing protein [Nitrospirota bacterium]
MRRHARHPSSLTWLLVLYLCASLAAPLPVGYAQITTALTESGLGTRISEPVTLPSGKINYDITGGTRPGNGPNLFHSFGEFSLATNNIANFLNETSLPTNNIISRVTGGNPSNIWGTIQTTDFGTANLYLINPAGIVFGPTAELNVGGAFNASTADYLRMTDGARFHADLPRPSTLSIAPVEAFGFTVPRPVAITIQQSNLAVLPGQSLSVIGGDITIVGRGTSSPEIESALRADSGRINLVSVASAGEVVLTAPGTPPSLKVHSFEQLGTITITDNRQATDDAAVRVAGDPGGTIFIRSAELELTDVQLGATTLGALDHPGVGFDIQVTGDIIMNRSEFGSSTFGAGDAGAVRITAGSLQMVGDPARNFNSNIGSRAFSTAADAGNGNDIEITTGSLLLRDQAFINTTTFGPGHAGNIRVNTGRLELLGGQSAAFISTSTQGAGNAGSLEINAEAVRMVGGVGFTGLASQVTNPGSGNGSSLRITAQTIEVLNGAQINSGVFTGPGRGGDIEITADTVLISGLDSNGFPAGIFSNLGFPARGTAGNIRVTTTGDFTISNGGQISSFSGSFGNSGHIDVRARNLYLTDNGLITSSNFGAGLGGNVTIEADSVRLSGPGAPNLFHGIFALGGFVAQRAGNISITTGSLDVLDGALISARTNGIGPAGNIEITADRLLIAGADHTSASAAFDGIESGIVASSLAFQPRPDLATGNGGSITLNVETIELHDQGRIQARSTGAGDAGSIEIDTNRLSISSGATISAESTGTGDAGGITIDAGDVKITGVATSLDPFETDLTGLSTKTITGTGGTLNVTTGSLAMTDKGIITSSTTGTGDAGSVTLNVGTLTAQGNSEISSSSSTGTGTGRGDAGSVTVQGVGGSGTSASSVTLNNSDLLTSAAGDGQGGSILVRAGDVTLLNGATVSATANAGNGGSISLVTTGNTFTSTNSSITTEANTGAGGSISISSATSMELTDSTVSATVTGGEKAGGTITLTAQDLTITGGSREGGGSVQAITKGAGPGGNIMVNVDTLSLTDADINASSGGAGRGGNITVAASESASFSEGSLEAVTRGTGDGGRVTVTTPLLTMTDNSFIQAATLAAGNAGSIELNVGTASIYHSQVSAAAEIGSSGRGGSITIQGLGGTSTMADRLEVSGPEAVSFISASTFGTGDAGSLEVFADTVTLRGGGPEFVGLTTQVASEASAAAKAGSLQVSANTLEVLDGAQISAGIFAGSGQGGSVEINADTIFISGLNQGGFPAGIFAGTNFPARGNAGNIRIVSNDLTLTNFGQINAFSNTFGNSGNIDIQTNNLTATNGAFITSTNFGAGLGGDVSIRAGNIRLAGPGPVGGFTGVFAIGGFVARRAGNISITTGSLDILDGAQISARTSGLGPAGDIDISADHIFISGADPGTGSFDGTSSGIFASTLPAEPFPNFGTGDGGNVQILVEALELHDQGTIRSLSRGEGDAGTIDISANVLSLNTNASITAESTGNGDAGSITIHGLASPAVSVTLTNGFVLTQSSGTGAGGSIDIDTTMLTLDRSTISASVKDVPEGDDPAAGVADITLRAPTLQMTGGAVTAETSGTRNAGSITLNVRTLTAQNNAHISSSSTGVDLNGDGTLDVLATGDAGSVTIQGLASPADSVSLTNSAVLTSAAGTGAGGSITVDTRNLALTNATVSASVKDVPEGGDPPTGLGNITLTASQETTLSDGTVISAESTGTRNAGTVTIRAGQNFLVTNSQVTTEALSTSGGNINISANRMIRLTNSGITTSVFGPEGTTGGDIFIDPQFVILQNSQILAQATEGRGGNINILAGLFLADPNSRVSATSQRGVSGEVNIQSPIQNLSGALVPLNQDYLQAATLLAQRCVGRMADAQTSTFIVVEHEGLPREPGGVLPSSLEESHASVTEQHRIEPIIVAAVSDPFSTAPAREQVPIRLLDRTCRR